MNIKSLANKAFRTFTGYQLARPSETLHFEGVQKRNFDDAFVLASKPYGKILDVGAGPRSMVKKNFPNVYTIDQRDMGGVDFVGDIHELSSIVGENSFDTVICSEVFEHTKRPWIAIREIYKVLRPGGMFIGVGPLIHELHDEDYGDYWRITPQGWELLLEEFGDIHIESRGVWPQINHVAVRAKKVPTTVVKEKLVA
jgi:SAM-dependent methyltransferase